MPPLQSIVLVDTMAIKLAHDFGCWNAIRKMFRLHSVPKCVEEATRANKDGAVLVRRSADDLAAELVLGNPDRLQVTTLTLQIGSQADLNEGEKHLLAYALTLRGVWFLCGPDNGTVRAMQILSLLDRMVSFETVANASGHRFKKDLPYHFSERWLSSHRLEGLLQGSASL